jgi:hypothetical protein
MERLKCVIAMYVGGQHINPADMQCRAPMNPIIGETV